MTKETAFKIGCALRAIAVKLDDESLAKIKNNLNDIEELVLREEGKEDGRD